VSKETRFQSGEVTILRLKKGDLVSAREDEFLLLGGRYVLSTGSRKKPSLALGEKLLLS
jgi:hypothetical protein